MNVTNAFCFHIKEVEKPSFICGSVCIECIMGCVI